MTMFTDIPIIERVISGIPERNRDEALLLVLVTLLGMMGFVDFNTRTIYWNPVNCLKHFYLRVVNAKEREAVKSLASYMKKFISEQESSLMFSPLFSEFVQWVSEING